MYNLILIGCFFLFFFSNHLIADTATAVVEGRYHWELVFSYDNSNNDGEIVHKIAITKQRSIDVKEFLSSKFNIRSSFMYEKKVSTGIEFKGAKSTGDISYHFHTELAQELVRTSETRQSFQETTIEEKTYTISGRGKLDLYRLVYESNGMVQKTNIVSTSPKPNTTVELYFSVDNRILGLSEILQILMTTYPGSSNVSEWTTIRNKIVSNSHKNDCDKFLALVHTLKIISPGSHNIHEWRNIRKTCDEIVRDWKTYDKQVLFNKLLHRFVETVPGRHNTSEWARIRSKSSQILSKIKEMK